MITEGQTMEKEAKKNVGIISDDVLVQLNGVWVERFLKLEI